MLLVSGEHSIEMVTQLFKQINAEKQIPGGKEVLGKAFHRVRCDVVTLAMRKRGLDDLLGIEEQ